MDKQTQHPDEAETPQSDLPQDPTPPQVTDDAACVTCQYALRGLALSADCPECGLPVRVSLDRLNGISTRQFCTLALRLFAIILVGLSLAGPAGLIESVVWFFADTGFGSLTFDEYIWFFVSPLSRLLTGVVLWFVAPLIACIVAPQSLPLIANIGGSRQAMRMVAAIFAAWLIMTGAESLVATVAAYSLERNDLAAQSYYATDPAVIVQYFFRLIVGIFLLGWLINRRKLAI